MMIRWSLLVALAAVVGCGTPVNNSGTGGTVSDSGTGGGGGNTCNDSCAAQARANCSAFQMGPCVSSCQAQYNAAPSCAALLDAAVRCAASATYTCSAMSNRPTTTSCVAEGLMALQCVQNASADAGARDGGA